ncbi:MAG: hypothetical protein WD020_06105, partial [Acidimicrobiia bacterium]
MDLQRLQRELAYGDGGTLGTTNVRIMSDTLTRPSERDRWAGLYSRVRQPVALLGIAMLLVTVSACQTTSAPDQSTSTPDHTLDGLSDAPGTEVELVERWIDGALVGAFEDIDELTYGEFGEPAAMVRLAEQLHTRALAAPTEPQVTVTDLGTDGTLASTCFRIDYGNGADVGMILTR